MDGSSITDPFDFPKDAPGLPELDAALRCAICMELFDAPTTTPCGHCFCSMCIRNFLATSDDSACPKCRKNASEHQLRPNPALEDAVVAWNIARSAIQKLYKEIGILEAENERTRQSKKRKRDPLEDIPVASSSKVKRESSARLSEDEIMFVESSEVEEIAFESLVACPACGKKIKHGLINRHLDSGCTFTGDVKPKNKKKGKGKEAERDSWSKIFNKKPHSTTNKNKLKEDAEPLPMPTYATLKDKQVKDLLAAYDLPLTGDRAELISRHEQWVRLYNANLDRSPKLRHAIQELRVQLKKTETQQNRRVSKPVVDDTIAHQIKYKEQFAHLIEQARPKKKAMVEVDHPPPNSSPRTTPASQTSSDCNSNNAALDS